MTCGGRTVCVQVGDQCARFGAPTQIRFAFPFRPVWWTAMPRFTDTIAALATPVGTSALAVLRVSGPDTTALCHALFGRTPPPRELHRADYRDRAGTLLDEVLFVRFQGPHSYTGEDALEISSHGNPFIAQRILTDLFARGCRSAEPGEFTQRAFLNGRMDLSQAEAVVDLIHARGDRALAAANQQLRGALGRQVNAAIAQLLSALAQVEAYIDFPEEDLPTDSAGHLDSQLAAIQSNVSRILATRQYGELLRDGIKTVIVGAPNVGKSSLLNRLVGRDRALVSAEPGTTRDFIEERIVLGAYCLRLIDTAGINSAPAPLERLGIEKSYERLAEADLVLAVVDLSDPSPALPEPVVQRLRAETTIVVGNKADVAQGSFPLSAHYQSFMTCCVSALTGAGFEELVAAIGRFAGTRSGDFGAETIAVNARHAEALAEAMASLAAARMKLASPAPAELLASDLRSALTALGQIAGKVDNERMLDELFATFCIGK